MWQGNSGSGGSRWGAGAAHSIPRRGVCATLLAGLLLVTLAACDTSHAAMPTPASTPRVLALPPMLAGLQVFVADLFTGDVAELGARTYHVAESVHGLGLSADHRTLYVSDIAGGNLLAFPLTSAGLGQPHRVKVGAEPVHMVQTLDGRWIYVTNFGEASVSLVDAATWRVAATLPVPASPHGIAIAPDGRLIYVACVNGGAIALLDTTTQRSAGSIALPPGAHPYGVALSLDGRYLYVPDNFAPRLFTIDTTTRQLVGETAIGQAAALLTRSADGTTLYVTNGKSATVSVLDLRADPAHPHVRATIGVGRFPHGLALTPDGRYLIVANDLGDSLSVIATATDQVVATIAGEHYPNDVLAVA